MKLTRTSAHPCSGPKRGVAAVELAIALPLLLTLLLGVWDMGRLIDVTQILNNATREGGRRASTGQDSVAQIQQAVLDYLIQAKLKTDGAIVTVTNLTNAANSDPTTADQLDQFEITATLPSNNVRWVAMNNLLGSNTLKATCRWSSMRDIPLIVPTSIPIN
ncbi:TadE/TadG family type IV pilus assembly protein [Singulisphaera acidiphila]|uniref:TadE-like protein n=1 Tax=Singulisphaera acidiphila (strain ATCC BAA-1392 / DSM 18658 / VKM B-2454 / MOB10) TaxID=886293 RepID=L0DR69_SINAD|nr:TadE/TadG family type IV pilus assembly protein [Singulisphaera acidiphila]AGA31523.1 TadE-like protein [Singulisphaera acidiphila DSM 18658]